MECHIVSIKTYINLLITNKKRRTVIMNHKTETTKFHFGTNPTSFEGCQSRLEKGFADAQIPISKTVNEESVDFIGKFQPKEGSAKKYPFRLKLSKADCHLEINVLVDSNVKLEYRAAIAVLCCCMNVHSRNEKYLFNPIGGTAILTHEFNPTQLFRSTACIEVGQIFSAVEDGLDGYAMGISDILSGKDPCLVYEAGLLMDESILKGDDGVAPTILFQYQHQDCEPLIDEDWWKHILK